MEPLQPSGEEQILLTVADQSKLDLVMELLSHFDLVQAQHTKALAKAEAVPAASSSAADFLALAGIWEGRGFDLERQRREAFERRTVRYDR